MTHKGSTEGSGLHDRGTSALWSRITIFQEEGERPQFFCNPAAWIVWPNRSSTTRNEWCCPRASASELQTSGFRSHSLTRRSRLGFGKEGRLRDDCDEGAEKDSTGRIRGTCDESGFSGAGASISFGILILGDIGSAVVGSAPNTRVNVSRVVNMLHPRWRISHGPQELYLWTVALVSQKPRALLNTDDPSTHNVTRIGRGSIHE